MYSPTLLAALVEARYAARLAEAERHRQLRQAAEASTRRWLGLIRRGRIRPVLPRRRRSVVTPQPTCAAR